MAKDGQGATGQEAGPARPGIVLWFVQPPFWYPLIYDAVKDPLPSFSRLISTGRIRNRRLRIAALATTTLTNRV